MKLPSMSNISSAASTCLTKCQECVSPLHNKVNSAVSFLFEKVGITKASSTVAKVATGAILLGTAATVCKLAQLVMGRFTKS